jgi:acyl-CoA-binding protein
MLKLYALYKQATEGDAPDEGPSDMIGKFKHKSWLEKRGMSADAAMQAYIDLVASLQ